MIFCLCKFFTGVEYFNTDTGKEMFLESKIGNIFGGEFTAWDSLKICPVIAASFAGHMNAPKMYGELKDKSLKNWTFIVLTSHLCVAFVILFIGVCGLAAFGPDVMKSKGDIFFVYQAKGSVFCVITLACMAMSVAFTVPIMFNPMRDGFFNLCKTLKINLTGENGSRIIFTILGMVVSCVICAMSPDLRTVSALKGLLFSLTLNLVLPAFLYLRMISFLGKKRECDPILADVLVCAGGKKLEWVTLSYSAYVFGAISFFIGCWATAKMLMS